MDVQDRQRMGRFIVLPWRAAWIASRQIVRAVRRLQFAECGRHVRFDPFGSYTPMNAMRFGSHVYIGPGARITANEGFFTGGHVVVEPGLLVVGGDHNTAITGRYMLDVKTGGTNLPVRIEDDVHLGARVTLLKGTVIGEGSVVGACSVVTRSIPPYCIAAGSPCRALRPRFTGDELRRHLGALRSQHAYDDVIQGWRAAGISPELIDGV